MRTPNLSRRIVALTIAAAALVGLTGCTGSPVVSGSVAPSESASESGSDSGAGDGTQTVDEACQLIDDTMTEATAEFENLDPDNPDAIVEGMKAAAQSLTEASSQISNEEVAAIVPELQSMFEEVADLMQSIVDGDASKLGELQEVGAGFQETALKFQELCDPAE